MDLKLTRTEFTPNGIVGRLTGEQDRLVAWTLEHAYPAQPTYQPKIPPGSYRCVRGQHRLHHSVAPFITFEVTGVPGHDNILFHVGNYNSDSDGCILVGLRTAKQLDGSPMLTGSRSAFTALMNLQNGSEAFILTVV